METKYVKGEVVWVPMTIEDVFPDLTTDDIVYVVKGNLGYGELHSLCKETRIVGTISTGEICNNAKT